MRTGEGKLYCELLPPGSLLAEGVAEETSYKKSVADIINVRKFYIVSRFRKNEALMPLGRC